MDNMITRPKIAFYVGFVAGRRVRFYIRDEYAPNEPYSATRFESDDAIFAHPSVVALRAQDYPIRTEYL